MEEDARRRAEIKALVGDVRRVHYAAIDACPDPAAYVIAHLPQCLARSHALRSAVYREAFAFVRAVFGGKAEEYTVEEAVRAYEAGPLDAVTTLTSLRAWPNPFAAAHLGRAVDLHGFTADAVFTVRQYILTEDPAALRGVAGTRAVLDFIGPLTSRHAHPSPVRPSFHASSAPPPKTPPAVRVNESNKRRRARVEVWRYAGETFPGAAIVQLVYQFRHEAESAAAEMDWVWPGVVRAAGIAARIAPDARECEVTYNQ